MRVRQLQQSTELLDRRSCIASDAPHGVCIDGIVPRDGNDAHTIAHDTMLSLTRDKKAGLLERAHRVKVIDAWEAGQG